MHVSREGDLVTVINVFETKPEQQQEVIDQWIRALSRRSRMSPA